VQADRASQKQQLVGLIRRDLRRTFGRDARTAVISQLDLMAIGGWGLQQYSNATHIVSGSDQRDSLRKLETRRENDRRELHVFFTSDPHNDDETNDSQVNLSRSFNRFPPSPGWRNWQTQRTQKTASRLGKDQFLNPFYNLAKVRLRD
jgi:hypothetical protein